jgi:hypothetical protein
MTSDDLPRSVHDQPNEPEILIDTAEDQRRTRARVRVCLGVSFYAAGKWGVAKPFPLWCAHFLEEGKPELKKHPQLSTVFSVRAPQTTST